MACLQFERLGLDRVAVPTVSYVDHNVLQFDNKNPEDHAYLRSWAARYGALYSRPGNGIAHYLHLERFSRPGQVLLGADSHTTMAGALGMLAIGAGATEVAVAMAGRPYPVERPLVVGVELRGRLQPWVQSKDVILELLRRRGVRGGRGRIFEFFGEGVCPLSATDRGTICNMVMETGATTGLFPSDEQTRLWLAAQGREGDFAGARPDRQPRLTADPRHDRAERRLRRPARVGRADPRARLRAVHRDGPGAGGGRGVGADLQPELPRSQRHGGRSRLSLLARDR